jgi:hypothetical protein
MASQQRESAAADWAFLETIFFISHPDEIKATKISLGRQTHTDLPC